MSRHLLFAEKINEFYLEDIKKLRILCPEIASMSTWAIHELWFSFSQDCYSACWINIDNPATVLAFKNTVFSNE